MKILDDSTKMMAVINELIEEIRHEVDPEQEMYGEDDLCEPFTINTLQWMGELSGTPQEQP